MRVKACLNGSRRQVEHRGVPVTPAELAQSAADAVAAGAEAVHLHPRARSGRESLAAAEVGAAVAAVRRACPGVPIGVTTGLWIMDGNVTDRQLAISRWVTLPASDRPDFASVNLGEPGHTMLVETLRDSGIGVEAGVWTDEDVATLAEMHDHGLLPALTRVLVEVMQAPASGAEHAADRLLAGLDAALEGLPGPHPPRLLHGEGATCWPVLAHAGRLGLPTRIGLEDTLTGPDGEQVPDNATLVRLGLSAWLAARGGAGVSGS